MLATAIRTTAPLAPSDPRLRYLSEARLRLAPPAGGADRLAGAWWPRSRDLRRELPELIPLLDPHFGRIARVTVDGGLWDEPPRRIAAGADTIDVGWFRSRRAAAEVCVLSNSTGRRHLLVLPPDCDFAESALLMAASGELDEPAALRWMTRLSADAADEAGRSAREAVWDSEGGALPAPAGWPSDAPRDRGTA